MPLRSVEEIVQQQGRRWEILAEAGRRAARALTRGALDGPSAAEARARARALVHALTAWPETARLRSIERRLARLDGRELEPFLLDA